MEDNQTYSYQVSDDMMILAGGRTQESHMNEIIKIENDQLAKFKLKYPKKLTVMAFNQVKSNMYIIGGEDSQSQNPPSQNPLFSNKCEQYNIKTNDQQIIAQHPLKLALQGMSVIEDQVITMGGKIVPQDNQSLPQVIDQIWQFNQVKNEWIKQSKVLPNPACSLGVIYNAQRESTLLFGNYYQLGKTYQYDGKQFNEDGLQFPYNGCNFWYNPCECNQII